MHALVRNWLRTHCAVGGPFPTEAGFARL